MSLSYRSLPQESGEATSTTGKTTVESPKVRFDIANGNTSADGDQSNSEMKEDLSKKGVVTGTGGKSGKRRNMMDPSDGSIAAILYENHSLMFSAIHERGFRMSLMWKPWSTRVLKIYSDGLLTYARPNRPDYIPDHHQYILEDIEVELVENEGAEEATRGLKVKCYTLDKIETYFRIIGKPEEIDRFLAVLQAVAQKHNIGSHSTTSVKVQKPSSSSIVRVFMPKRNQSAMRRAVGRAMDSHDKRSKRERILAKRCVMKSLPVIGDNDLIHGSWWFVIGSIGVTLTSFVVVINSLELHTDQVLDNDDSQLSRATFAASWILLTISGVFSTLGSLAFVRAFHEDPPMKPLFYGYYHLQSDELLASWLFFGACVPFVPYCLCFLSSSAYSRNLMYLLGLAVAILTCLGSLLFVRACYPSDKSRHRDLLYPFAKYLCCCCLSESWRRHHLMNDWLGASWLFLWSCEFGTLVCAILFFVAVAEKNTLRQFIFGTSFFESLAYTIGSAYFVTGSYPEEYVAQYVQAGNKVPPLTENTFASGKGSSNGCRSTIDLEADDCSVRDGEVEVSFAGEIIESSSDEPRVVSKRGWFG